MAKRSAKTAEGSSACTRGTSHDGRATARRVHDGEGWRLDGRMVLEVDESERGTLGGSSSGGPSMASGSLNSNPARPAEASAEGRQEALGASR
jgi:hypothetical protein